MTRFANPVTFRSIELLRFFAASAVVFYHIPGVGIGRFGVDIFFVISGFVMMVATECSFDNFFLKRLIRIVPSYYLFTIFVFVLAILYPSWFRNTSPDLLSLLKSLAFVPFDKNGAGHYPILFVGWTLNYEVYFYLLFAIALKFGNRYRALICTILISLVGVIGSFSKDFILQVYASSIVYEFVLGMLIYVLLFKKCPKEALLICITVILSILVARPDISRLLCFGVPAAGLVCFCVMYLENIRWSKWILNLGGSSYALYLIHPFTLKIFERYVNFSFGLLGGSFSANVLVFVLTCTAALGYYMVIEKFVNRKLRILLIRN